MGRKSRFSGFGILLALAGVYIFPFGTDMAYYWLMNHYNLSFEMATWYLYLISVGLFLFGVYLVNPDGFKKKVVDFLR